MGLWQTQSSSQYGWLRQTSGKGIWTRHLKIKTIWTIPNGMSWLWSHNTVHKNQPLRRPHPWLNQISAESDWKIPILCTSGQQHYDARPLLTLPPVPTLSPPTMSPSTFWIMQPATLMLKSSTLHVIWPSKLTAMLHTPQSLKSHRWVPFPEEESPHTVQWLRLDPCKNEVTSSAETKVAAFYLNA